MLLLVTITNKICFFLQSTTYNSTMLFVTLSGADVIALTNDPAIFYVFAALWPVIFAGIWAIWNMVRDSRDERLVERSLAWPEAQGKVVTSKVVWSHVEVRYEYSISSGRYQGRFKINLPVGAPDRYGQTAARMNGEALQDMADFPPGANVIVRYDPQKLEQSVLYCRGEISRDVFAKGSGALPKFFTLR